MASTQQQGLIVRVGPLEIDWPRTLGYFGGAAAGVAFGIIEAPLAVVIAAAPLARMLDHPRANRATRFLGQMFEGAVKPVGGDDDGTIRLAPRRSGARGGATRRRQPVKRRSPSTPRRVGRRRTAQSTSP